MRFAEAHAISAISRGSGVAHMLEGEARMAMSIPASLDRSTSRDPRTHAILAKSIYRELRANGYDEQAVMAIAAELLGMVAAEVKDKRAR